MAIWRKRSESGQPISRELRCPRGGVGTLVRNDVFEGVATLLLDIHAPEVELPAGQHGCADALVVLHCRMGKVRFCLSGADQGIELSEGHAALLRADESTVSLLLPDSYARAAAVRICPRTLPLSARHGMAEFGVDIKGIIEATKPQSVCVLENAVDMAHTFAELYNLLQAPEPSRGYLRLKAIELLLLLGCSGPRGGQEGEIPSSLFAGRMQIAYRAQHVMSRHLSDPLGVEALARLCEVSPTVLKEAFRETFGMPVGTWYRAYRINRACEMLRHDRASVADVAHAVGYASASKFSRAFSAVKGVAPSVWRKGDGMAEAYEDEIPEELVALPPEDSACPLSANVAPAAPPEGA